VVYKNFVVHPETVMQVHLAACAADKQGKFLDFKRLYWKKGFAAYAQSHDPSAIDEQHLLAIAAEVGLDKNKLSTDMKSAECHAHIQTDMNELDKFGVNATPSFFINGKFSMFSGPDAFNAAIDAALADVAKSGVPAEQYYEKVVMGQGLKTFRSKKDAQAAKNGG